MATTFSWVLQLHKGVPKAARFYSQGLDFAVNVCTLRWAELQSGPLKLALVHSNRSGLICFDDFWLSSIGCGGSCFPLSPSNRCP
ncbi:uncharacterized protein LOC110022268 isoform X2 [Phalaenopsis equestris]|uniref:uncharacterized protein LOC110022268 isoform X2 n=1 Tax=Phalaenopsis equestris TaxID=78828 RepID=UPI0009E60F48|nr:uncharacterized protein LOC110022268 isoform X2 [Phalaenopsis equestris]